jgi:acetolactate decarboxylase
MTRANDTPSSVPARTDPRSPLQQEEDITVVEETPWQQALRYANRADPYPLYAELRKAVVSEGLWRALLDHTRRNQDSLAHVVSKALAEYLRVAHHTLYQVSTATALVEGIYQGAVCVGTLREHGDLGLGTFEDLDGEMVVVDGQFYQVRSDGSVRKCGDDVLSPFAAVTRFAPETQFRLPECAGLSQLNAQFDALRHSDNVFFALRVDGHFDYVHTRAMCRTREGVPLVQAAAVQPEFEFHDVTGTLVGFWTPEYAKTLNVPGYHLHFVSADRKKGGHLLQCRGQDLRLQIQREATLAVALPETEDFLKADLRRDPTADLARAEGEKK